MLTGSVVGDGEYATLAELFAASGGALAFYGTLSHEHDCGESTLPVAYVLRAPEEPSAHSAEVITDARRTQDKWRMAARSFKYGLHFSSV